jgi:23S rRNA (adenine1618-N6)-methyltransferase
MNQKLSQFHHKNKHQGRYDFDVIKKRSPELEKIIIKNKHTGEETIDFSDNKSLIIFNRSLLKSYYPINFWEIPKGYLVPPIPGRADVIHYLAELFKDPLNKKVLDIGVGANCIYPLIGTYEYGWTFLAVDTDKEALLNAENIINKNNLTDKIQTKLQENKENIFQGIVNIDDHFDLSICNPPFHASLNEALSSAYRKSHNLNLKKLYNFKGQSNELWCEGGEVGFINKMIKESFDIKTQITFFSTLVSKKDHLSGFYGELKRLNPKSVHTIEMGQGNKMSRLLVWSFIE